MTNAELEKQVIECDRTIREAVEYGDQEALEFLQQYGDPLPRATKTNDFITRLSAAGEQYDLVSPEVRAFVKAYATGDRAAMRAAVRPVVLEMFGAQ